MPLPVRATLRSACLAASELCVRACVRASRPRSSRILLQVKICDIAAIARTKQVFDAVAKGQVKVGFEEFVGWFNIVGREATPWSMLFSHSSRLVA